MTSTEIPFTGFEPYMGNPRRFATLRAVFKARLAGLSAGFIALVVVVAVLAPVLAPRDPTKIDVPHRLLAPSWSQPMGTDQNGRDVFSRVIFSGALGTNLAPRRC